MSRKVEESGQAVPPVEISVDALTCRLLYPRHQFDWAIQRDLSLTLCTVCGISYINFVKSSRYLSHE